MQPSAWRGKPVKAEQSQLLLLRHISERVDLTPLVLHVVRSTSFDTVAVRYRACFRHIRGDKLVFVNDKLTSSLQVGHRSEIVFLVESVFA